MVKKGLLLVAIGLVIGWATSEAGEKYGYVNLEKVFNEYQKTKDEESKLTKEGEAKQKEIDARLKEIDKLKEELDLLSDKEKEKKKAELDKKMQELKTFDRKIRADLMRKRDTIIREILREIDQAIQKYGKSKGYTIIFNSRALLFKDDKLDLTDKMIKYLNDNYGEGADK